MSGGNPWTRLPRNQRLAIGTVGILYALVGLSSPPPISPEAIKNQEDKAAQSKARKEAGEA